jgi:uncharacterized protein
MARKPFVSITGPSGGNLVDRLADRLSYVQIVDQAGAESDTLDFEVRIRRPFPAGPAKGTRYQASIGWDAAGSRVTGTYTVQTAGISGDAESGWSMRVHCRAADYLDEMKKVDSEHFDDMSAGDIFRKLAGGNVVVDPEIASIQIPYRLRWNQPAIDFADQLASELGGTMKVAADRLLVMKRGGGRSATGAAFPPVIIRFEDVIGGGLEKEERGAFRELQGAWFDPVRGIRQLAEATGLGDLSRFMPVHPFQNEAQAAVAAEAFGKEEARKAATGSIDMPGNPEATAEAPVRLIGFGPDFDGLKLVCAAATHEVTFDEGGGWTTTIELEGA